MKLNMDPIYLNSCKLNSANRPIQEEPVIRQMKAILRLVLFLAIDYFMVS